MRRSRCAATAALVGLLVGGCGTASVPAQQPVPVPADAVPADGDRVSGWGWIVQERDRGAAQLCRQVVDTGGTGFAPCTGVPLLGLDTGRLQDRRDSDLGVAGWAAVTGTWRDGAVEVEEQGPPPRPVGHVDDAPPCPAPPGGWPSTHEHDRMDAEMAALRASYFPRRPSGPDRFAQLHVSPTQTLFGFAVPDEAARVRAERELRPLLGDRMCVVVARHSDEEVAAVKAVDWSAHPAVGTHGIGLVDLQAVMQVEVLVMDDELVALAAQHPEGLLDLQPTLRVVARAPAPSPSPTAADPRIPDDGSRVTATGYRQDADGQVRLRSLFVLRGMVREELEPPCRFGVAVEDLGAAAGTLTVTGTLRGEVLVAERVEPAPQQSWGSGLPQVPCPAPPGGWPDGGAPYDDRSPDDALMVRLTEAYPDLSRDGRLMLLRPAPDRQVVTAIVPDEAERDRLLAVLGADVPGRACVVVQEHDLDLSTQAMHDHRLHAERLQIGAGTEFAPGLRTRAAHVKVLRLSELLLRAQASYPPGVVVLEPFLEVVPD